MRITVQLFSPGVIAGIKLFYTIIQCVSSYLLYSRNCASTVFEEEETAHITCILCFTSAHADILLVFFSLSLSRRSSKTSRTTITFSILMSLIFYIARHSLAADELGMACIIVSSRARSFFLSRPTSSRAHQKFPLSQHSTHWIRIYTYIRTPKNELKEIHI